jgi:hypothetical protein
LHASWLDQVAVRGDHPDKRAYNVVLLILSGVGRVDHVFLAFVLIVGMTATVLAQAPLVVVQNLESGQGADPEFLTRAREEARPVSLNEGETKAVDVTLSKLTP